MIQQLTLLMVDDNPFTRNLVRNFLLNIGAAQRAPANSHRAVPGADYDRLLSILLKTRRSVKLGDYSGPAPHRPIALCSPRRSARGPARPDGLPL